MRAHNDESGPLVLRETNQGPSFGNKACQNPDQYGHVTNIQPYHEPTSPTDYELREKRVEELKIKPLSAETTLWLWETIRDMIDTQIQHLKLETNIEMHRWYRGFIFGLEMAANKIKSQQFGSDLPYLESTRQKSTQIPAEPSERRPGEMDTKP